MTHDPRFLKGFELFNNEEFFEAHEVWEDLWHATFDDSKDFVQGLIQVTSALHHLRNGNMRGARMLHDSGLELLSGYGDSYHGLDLKKLKMQFDAALEGILNVPIDQLAGRGHAGPVKIPYEPAKAPKVELQEP